MDRKDIQSNRMKKYFIDATKELVKRDGVGEIRVKKISELAGYAPATLYNYFEDLNELLFYVGVEFFKECKEYVLERVDKSDELKEQILCTAKAYSSYFIENPNIFRLLFLYDLEMPKEWQKNGYVPEIAKVIADYLILYAQEGYIDKNNIEIVLGLLANSIHGALLFYIKERGGLLNTEDIINKIEKETKYVLEK